MIISAPRLFIDGGFTGPGAVEIASGRVVKVIFGPVDADIRLTHGFLSPGLIDLHNNGAFGVDCATATPAEWDFYIQNLAARGVTSVLPTIITAPMADLCAAAGRVADAMARHGGIIGLHLEGPFLAPGRRGAHQEVFLALPDEPTISALLADASMRAVLRVVTLAPELPGALVAIKRLTAAGIAVSLGHTDATAEEMRAGVDSGASLVTHVFNAQSPLGHRAPGAPGVALTDERLFPCLIVDGVHVGPTMLQLAFAACPRAIAVTDSILVAGLQPGAAAEFGGATVVLGEQGVGLRPDGTIAGAGITLDEGVRRLISFGIAPEIALAAATERPAEALGLRDLGRIVPDARADIIWWDDDFTVQRVWVAGVTDAQPVKTRGTESARDDLVDLDDRATLDVVKLFLAQEQSAQRALQANAPNLAQLADAVALRMQAGGRLFYAGAGTSGRLGFLDAVECGPTFGVKPGVIIPLLAGGEGAFVQAAEGAEDDTEAAISALKAASFTADDALVGIAASGGTPFTLAALRYAKEIGALTGAIVNNAGSKLAEVADIAVQIISGPEVIAGSTRLSAGTTQKIALNTLSSTVMLRLGKVYGPYMVDMRATNAKLRRRALRMVMDITKADERAAGRALNQANMHVKTAVLMLLREIPVDEAASKLELSRGSLRQALKE